MYKLFINAHIHTMLTPVDKAVGMLCRDGRILELFPDVLPSLPDAEIIDLKNSYVYPGFIDTHTHSFEGGLYSQAVNLQEARTIAEVLEKIDYYYREISGSEVNILFAFRFDENQIAERRFPTHKELTSVCPNKPLLLRRIDGHSCVINLLAREMYLANHTDISCVELENTEVYRGDVNDALVHWFHSNLSQEMVLNAYHNAAKIAAQNGHTTLHTMIGDAKDSITHYKLIAEQLTRFAVEYILYPQSLNLKAALEAGATRIGGCILADGSFGSHTAALRRPYHDAAEEFGVLYQTAEYWLKFISDATKNGLQVGIHCIGDKAIKQINDIYLKLQREYNHDLRHMLIHAELTPDDLVGEIALSHAACVMQPAFDLYWGGEDGFYAGALGFPRVQQMNRFKTLEQQGTLVTGGSDWYITELDALQGIRAAVHHNNPLERVTPFQAISMYTRSAALLSHDEHRLGTLEIGKQADFCCLTADLMQTEGLATAQVAATYKNATQIFSR